MSLRREHEIHGRRSGRNVGVGLMLGAFVILIMALTYVKITQTDFTQLREAVDAAKAEASE